ncbi:MAG TPA: beta-galactosidase [Planctomycetota bacterium]|nr:beta-galactosidase [Planctomycetota bacterium]
MSGVRVEGRALLVGREPLALLSGEVHYWRLAPQNWGACLDASKGLGLDLLSVYVPWTFHRLAPGRYDFRGEGDPRRDFVGFVDLAARKGFRLVVRPGPYVYAEWPNAGCPDEVVHLHRLHPGFLALAADWIRAVAEVLLPLLATRGGPVVLVQADNELDPFPTWHGRSLGLEGGSGVAGEEETPFARFLRERHGDVEALNGAWRSRYAAFEEAGAYASDPVGGEAGARWRREDYRDFVHDFVTRAARWTVDQFRARGVDVPISLNAYPDVEVQDLRALAAVAEVVGCDLYPSDGFGGGKDEHRRFLERLRATRVLTATPFVAEFSAGVWHGQHRFTGVPAGPHYLHAAASALLAGACGWNWYMLVDRDNWYGSPINEWGRARPDLGAAFSEAVALFHALDPPSLRKVANLAVTYGVRWHRDPHFGEDDPLLRALYEGGLDYEFFDVETGRWPDASVRLAPDGTLRPGPAPLLFYSGPATLPLAAAGRLVRYAEEGGTIVLFRRAPLRCEEGPLPAALPAAAPDFVTFGWGVRFEVALGSEKLLADGPVDGWGKTEGEPLVGRRVPRGDHDLGELEGLDAVPKGSPSVLGEIRSFGRGRILRLGFDPTPEAILAIARWAGVPVPVRARPRGAQASLFDGPKGRFLLVVHDGRQPPLAEVTLDPSPGAPSSVRDLSSGRIVGVAAGREPSVALSLERGFAAMVLPRSATDAPRGKGNS